MRLLSVFSRRTGILSIILLCACLVMAGGSTATRAEAADAAGAETASLSPEALEKLLEAHPEIVLNFLQKHSAKVYEIARDGNLVLRANALKSVWKKQVTKDLPKIHTKDRPIVGDKNAPVRIVAFSDFTCPYCANFAQSVAVLIKKYDGKINFMFKHFPLLGHEFAELASRYFIAAGMQDEVAAWKMYAEMYNMRERLLKEGEGFLKEIAKKNDLDMARLAKDIKSDRATRIIAEDVEDAEKMGINGTPSCLINSIVAKGALGMDLYFDAVNMALAEKAKKSKK